MEREEDVTWEPLSNFFHRYSSDLVKYGQEHGLSHLPVLQVLRAERTRWTSRGLGQELPVRRCLEAKEKGGTLGVPSKEEVPGHLGVGESHSGVHLGEQDSPASHILAILLGEPSG